MKRNALISVYYKEGILELAEGLVRNNFNIVSTGGTFKFLQENGINVTTVESITGFPEMLGGRVKTLHPKVFAGILSEKDNELHLADMKANGLSFFDLVVVNLYPFEETIKEQGCTLEEAIEKIDIGGVTLIRAAAKNYKYVNILVNTSQYKDYIEVLEENSSSIPVYYSQKLAYEAFTCVSEYDTAIQNYFRKLNSHADEQGYIKLTNGKELRYGENPHQKAYLFKENFDDIYDVIHGKELSYNNLLDVDAAYAIINEFKNDGPACAIIKHGNPSGIAIGKDLTDAYKRAFATDTVSPFGGIIIFNEELDFKTASEVDKLFTEIILAPEFEDSALELLRKKKNRRLLKFKFGGDTHEFRKIAGGILYQEKDNVSVIQEELKFVTKKKPDEKQLKDLLFAFRVVKHTKSNGIVFVKDLQTAGIGAGQPSRIDSTKIAIGKAGQFGIDLKGSVAASDAFFPFPDNVEEISKAGSACVIQPGGSVKDEDVIKTADELGLAMVFTGIRHFKH